MERRKFLSALGFITFANPVFAKEAELQLNLMEKFGGAGAPDDEDFLGMDQGVLHRKSQHHQSQQWRRGSSAKSGAGCAHPFLSV